MKICKQVIEKISLQLMFVTFVLAVLMFAVSPVPAAPPVECDTNFCDQDGDGFFRAHKRCADCSASLGIDCDDSDPNITDPPACDSGNSDETPVVYTVALTAGVFEFPATDASLNSKGHLNSVNTSPIVIARPPASTVERTAWDAVINDCAGSLVGGDPDDPMLVDFDEWGVGKNGDEGNLWINLPNIHLPTGNLVPEKKIQIQLQLRDNPGTRFLPDAEGSETFTLDYYVVWGKPLSGKKRSWDTCFQSGDSTGVVFPDATLVITRVPSSD